jgi:MYXO-CTERM domain-containing protein
VTGTIAIDTANSAHAQGGANQTGTLTLTQAGATTSLLLAGDPASMILSALSGALLNLGDGLGARLTVAGNTPGADNGLGLFVDYALYFSNTSATDTYTYTITLSGLFANSVSASGTQAFAYSDISVRDAGSNELLYSDERADTATPANNWSFSSADTTYALTLAPGAATQITAVQHVRGGAGAIGDSFTADLNARLVISALAINGVPVSNVPTPGALPMALAGLLTLTLLRRRA